LLFAYREVLQTKQAQKAVQGAKGGGLDFLKLPTVWMCFAFFFLTAMALGGVHSFAATALRELYGMSLNAATSAYSAFMLASAFGMFAGGVLAARGGKHDHTIAIAFVGSAVFAPDTRHRRRQRRAGTGADGSDRLLYRYRRTIT
jgi:predicted MFS family arabinose efflux permease